MKIAIYVRVSTGKQDLANQLNPLLEYSKNKGFEVVEIYKDISSGNSLKRNAMNKMLEDSHKRKFKAILIWALDRLTREGLSKTINLIEHLNKIGIDVISYSEPFLDTTNELVKNTFLALIASLAKAEREKISERTKAGLNRVKAKGIKIGRPTISDKIKNKVLNLLSKNLGIREIARQCNVSAMYVSIISRRQRNLISI